MKIKVLFVFLLLAVTVTAAPAAPALRDWAETAFLNKNPGKNCLPD